jgi:hypothetical protein
VPQVFETVRTFFVMYMDADSLDWLKGMSLWPNFTGKQAGIPDWALEERVQESVIHCTSHRGAEESMGKCTSDCRYSMHYVVREAGRTLLDEDKAQVEKARERFVTAMAEAGKEMHKLMDQGEWQTASSMAADELDNCLSFCNIPDEAITGVADDIQRLGDTLLFFGYTSGAEAVYRNVSMRK